MNEKQKDHAAGYLYDLSKGVVLLTVIKPVWTGELPALAIILGLLAAAGCFAWGSFIDGR